MTCVDHLVKLVQLVPLQESNAQTVAEKFLSTMVSQHSLPEWIMSNHNPHFCGHFWDEFISLLDMTLTFSMASYSQTNPIAEETNHAMEQLLYTHA